MSPTSRPVKRGGQPSGGVRPHRFRGQAGPEQPLTADRSVSDDLAPFRDQAI